MATTSVSKDRFTMWPTALACCFPAILIVIWTGPFDLALLGVPVLSGFGSRAVAMFAFDCSAPYRTRYGHRKKYHWRSWPESVTVRLKKLV